MPSPRSKIRIASIAIVATVFLCAAGTADACPTCKEAIHQNGSGTAYAVSILFMMSMPFVIMAFWTILILKLRAQARRLEAQSFGID